MPGSARSRALVPFDFGTQRRGYYLIIRISFTYLILLNGRHQGTTEYRGFCHGTYTVKQNSWYRPTLLSSIAAVLRYDRLMSSTLAE